MHRLSVIGKTLKIPFVASHNGHSSRSGDSGDGKGSSPLPSRSVIALSASSACRPSLPDSVLLENSKLISTDLASIGIAPERAPRKNGIKGLRFGRSRRLLSSEDLTPPLPTVVRNITEPSMRLKAEEDVVGTVSMVDSTSELSAIASETVKTTAPAQAASPPPSPPSPSLPETPPLPSKHAVASVSTSSPSRLTSQGPGPDAALPHIPLTAPTMAASLSHGSSPLQTSLSSPAAAQLPSPTLNKRRSFLWSWKNMSFKLAKRSDGNLSHLVSASSAPPPPPPPVPVLPYHLPRDIMDRDRLDRRHLMLRELMQTILPIAVRDMDAIHRVLDVGAGSGIWCLDLARELPNAHIIGCEASSVYPSSAALAAFPGQRIPANVEFCVTDARYMLAHPDNHFDLVHIRFMFPNISTQRYANLFAELHRLATPVHGLGAICVVETDFYQHRTGPCAALVNRWVHAYYLLRGLDPGILDSLAPALAHAGFDGIGVRTLDVGCGAWAHRAGEVALRELQDWVEAEVKPVTEASDWSDTEWRDFCEMWAEEVESHRTFWRIRVVWGYKPAGSPAIAATTATTATQ